MAVSCFLMPELLFLGLRHTSVDQSSKGVGERSTELSAAVAESESREPVETLWISRQMPMTKQMATIAAVLLFHEQSQLAAHVHHCKILH